MSVNIPRIHSRSNQYYPSLLGFFRLPLRYGGELRGVYKLPVHPIVHQCGISTRHLRAFEAALRVHCSVLQDEAVRLQIPILLQQAEPVFFPWTSDTSGQCVPTGCWHTTGVTLGALFPPLASRRRRYSREKGTLRAIEHTAAREGRHARMA
jgi:hypothetical protein